MKKHIISDHDYTVVGLDYEEAIINDATKNEQIYIFYYVEVDNRIIQYLHIRLNDKPEINDLIIYSGRKNHYTPIEEDYHIIIDYDEQTNKYTLAHFSDCVTI